MQGTRESSIIDQQLNAYIKGSRLKGQQVCK